MFAFQIVHTYKNLEGIETNFKLKLLQRLLEKSELTTEMVDYFFALLQVAEKKTFAFSSCSAKAILSRSASTAAKLVSQDRLNAMLSAELIFLPFFDEKSGYWNLITFQCSEAALKNQTQKNNLPSLHFFDSGTKNMTPICQRHLLR